MSFVIDGPVVEAINSGLDRYRYGNLQARPWRVEVPGRLASRAWVAKTAWSAAPHHTPIFRHPKAQVSRHLGIAVDHCGYHWLHSTYFTFSEHREGLKVGSHFTRPEMPPSLD
jgi:hypothetical protein